MDPRLLSTIEAAKVLGVSIHTLNNWKSQRRITFYRIGGRTMFDPADLEAVIQNGRVEAKSCGRN